MKSSSGKYFIGLDHVRAVAALMVFTWHFIHVTGGQKGPPPFFPLSLFTEGHTGVALFMTLSGYLFAKLLDGKKINYYSFIWNRILRLLPLLLLVILLVAIVKLINGQDLGYYFKNVFKGLVMPSLPNGGWSITIEFHFYMLLPFLLFLTRKWRFSLLVVLMFTLFLRVILYQVLGEVQTISYWTIFGHIDQFLFGILAFQFKNFIKGRHFIVSLIALSFAVFYWWFDKQGGFFMNQSYPSSSNIWVYLPTIEGFAYASVIAWYDYSFNHSSRLVSRFVALIGTYSYSIYLLHFFVVFRLSNFIHNNIIDLSNIYFTLIASVFSFILMVPIGYLSYRFVELPFLKYRTKYIIS